MTDSSVPEDDKLPEAEADARFQRLVGNLVKTPHTPHVSVKAKDQKRTTRSSEKPHS